MEFPAIAIVDVENSITKNVEERCSKMDAFGVVVEMSFENVLDIRRIGCPDLNKTL